MPAKIDVKVNSKSVTQAITELQKKGGNLTPAMDAVGRAIKSRINMGFRSGTSPWGAAWDPPKLRDGQPLRDTGRLQRSITYVADSTGVSIGTNLTSEHHGRTYIWPRVHQFGAAIEPRWAPYLVFQNRKTGGLVKSKGVVIPARPFLPINANRQVELPLPWQKSVLAALRAHFAKGLPT